METKKTTTKKTNKEVDEVEVIMISTWGYQLDKNNETKEYIKYVYDKEMKYNDKTYYAYSYDGWGERIEYIMVPSRNFSEIRFPFSDVYAVRQEEGSEEIYEPETFLNYWGHAYGLYGYKAEPENKVIIKRNERTTPTDANGNEYVDLGLPSGTLWATCNVGATSPTEYGKYFAWGETEEKHDFSWSTYKYNTSEDYGAVDNKLELELSDDAAHANMGGDWKMPTSAQMEELFNETNHVWVENYQGSGVAGSVFTSKTNGNTMFIPASGRCCNTSVGYQGSDARLWSSTFSALSPSYSVGGYFRSGDFGVGSGDRYFGFSVRGVITPAE